MIIAIVPDKPPWMIASANSPNIRIVLSLIVLYKISNASLNLSIFLVASVIAGLSAELNFSSSNALILLSKISIADVYSLAVKFPL
jgi:hypothetical protein